LDTEFFKARADGDAEKPREALYSGALDFSAVFTLRSEKFERLKRRMKSAGIRAHSKRFAGVGRQ